MLVLSNRKQKIIGFNLYLHFIFCLGTFVGKKGVPVEYYMGAMLLTQIGSAIWGGISSNKANKRALREQRAEYELQKAELERTKKREIEQKKRENMQLMNTVSGLTNTSFSGVSSPSLDYDKYGDLG